jgi:hypothetical protein
MTICRWTVLDVATGGRGEAPPGEGILGCTARAPVALAGAGTLGEPVEAGILGCAVRAVWPPHGAGTLGIRGAFGILGCAARAVWPPHGAGTLGMRGAFGWPCARRASASRVEGEGEDGSTWTG